MIEESQTMQEMIEEIFKKNLDPAITSKNEDALMKAILLLSQGLDMVSQDLATGRKSTIQ